MIYSVKKFIFVNFFGGIRKFVILTRELLRVKLQHVKDNDISSNILLLRIKSGEQLGTNSHVNRSQTADEWKNSQAFYTAQE